MWQRYRSLDKGYAYPLQRTEACMRKGDLEIKARVAATLDAGGHQREIEDSPHFCFWQHQTCAGRYGDDCLSSSGYSAGCFS